MRIAVLLLAGLVAACGPQLTPDEPVAPPPGQWWLGDWVVDLAALDQAESFRALAPEAQAVARDLVTGARWRLAFDTRRAHLPDGRLVPFSVDRSDEVEAVLTLATGESLSLQRRPGGLRLASHDLPLRRAD